MDEHGTVDRNTLDAHCEIKVLHKDNFDRVPRIRVNCHDCGPIIGVISCGKDNKVLVTRERFAICTGGVCGKQPKKIE